MKPTSSILRAGTALREITTHDTSRNIADPLYVKVLVLDDGAMQIAIVAMDVLAIGGIGDLSDNFLPKLRVRVEEELNIPASQLLVNASHTHPPGKILRDEEEVITQTLEAIAEATRNLTAVVVGHGKGHEDRISINRNLILKNGKHWTIRHANPCPPDEDVVAVGEIDPEIGVIRVDRVDGTPLALLYNFAIHLLFSDPQASVSAMIPGVASKIIEKSLGHGALAFFLQGAAGDIIDVGFKDLEQPRDITLYGERLALSTLQAWKAILPQDVIINALASTIQLPRRTDIPQRIDELHAEERVLLASLQSTTLNFRSFFSLFLKQKLNPKFPSNYSYAYLQAEKIDDDSPRGMDDVTSQLTDKYLCNIRAMERLALIQDDIATLQKHAQINIDAGEETISTDVLGVKIGDCLLITAPIEILTQVSLHIKRNSPCENTFMVAFTNGYMHYGPPASDYDKGGYEVTECLLAPQWEEVYTRAALQILRQLQELSC